MTGDLPTREQLEEVLALVNRRMGRAKEKLSAAQEECAAADLALIAACLALVAWHARNPDPQPTLFEGDDNVGG